MITNKQAQFLRRFENGGDFDTDEEFFLALEELKSSEELHYLVQLLNWDDWRTAKALNWVLSQSTCAAATALQIYWMNQPEDIYDSVLLGTVPSWQEDAYELHQKIEQLYLSRRFATQEIAFDPASENYDARSPAAQAIPIELKIPVQGTDLGEFYDRYPL